MPICESTRGLAPAWMPATGLSTPEAAITPTVLFQRTKVALSTQATAEVAHQAKGSSTANALFIFFPSFRLNTAWPAGQAAMSAR